MSFKTFDSLAEASKETGIPTGKLYSMARIENFPKIYLESSFDDDEYQFKIDENDFWDEMKLS